MSFFTGTKILFISVFKEAIDDGLIIVIEVTNKIGEFPTAILLYDYGEVDGIEYFSYLDPIRRSKYKIPSYRVTMTGLEMRNKFVQNMEEVLAHHDATDKFKRVLTDALRSYQPERQIDFELERRNCVFKTDTGYALKFTLSDKDSASTRRVSNLITFEYFGTNIDLQNCELLIRKRGQTNHSSQPAPKRSHPEDSDDELDLLFNQISVNSYTNFEDLWRF